MAKDNFVEVELIANPSVTRKMSENSLRLNKNKWRAVGAIQVPVEKKKVVEPVANSGGINPSLTINVPQDEFGSGPKGDVIPALTDKPDDLELARAAYFMKFGTKPDGRFSAARLNELINNPQ